MAPQQNTDVDNFFIDVIRFSALTTYTDVVNHGFTSRVLDSGEEERLIYTKKIRWHLVNTHNSLIGQYIWGSRELSRYRNAHYISRLHAFPAWQNNIQPYTQESAIACVTDIIESYRSILSEEEREDYLYYLNLVYIEVGIDFAELQLPNLAQLIRYVSSGRGSASRYLRLYAQPGVVYHYDKETRAWNNPIDDKMCMELVRGGRATIYVGSRNLEFKIYKKHHKIRIELAVRGRAQILKFLNSPLSADKSRHITKLADYRTIQHLSGCYLDRIAELFCGKIPVAACEAVDRALDTFSVSPAPSDWTKREALKQELPPLPCISAEAAAEEAIYIDTDRQRSLTSYVHNNAVISLFHVHSVSLVFSVYTRIRAPPRLFPPVHSIIHASSMRLHACQGMCVLLLVYYPVQGQGELSAHVYMEGHGQLQRLSTIHHKYILPIYALQLLPIFHDSSFRAWLPSCVAQPVYHFFSP